jgi:indole-3-glycerol phosphate synthase
MILDRILSTKKEEIAAAKALESEAQLIARCAKVEETPRGFARALRAARDAGRTALISEVKKGSPSKGIICADFDPLMIAKTYEQGGATCLSVLTDEQYFHGHLNYLQLIREQVSLPLLRKDFIIEPYQVYQARVAGADAILLIAAALSDAQMIALAGVARELGLDTLLEVHNEEELERSLNIPVDLIGINNRDLKTFVTDIAVTERLAARIPQQQLAVAESGIYSRADVERLSAAGAGAFLVGESLMREGDIVAKLQELLGA